ncbi:hypothetical protein JQX13_03155 [Archangium violaceum]|uniref:hypothetical protein n=1 Tax=Archangium violaceum TaxID=83451 RepID=UPI00193C35AB|nr:hypothetical protein [Archangium violaceum]QRK09172.1 hypothetical protein JQX13_03155 [Archangium violaceum]
MKAPVLGLLLGALCLLPSLASAREPGAHQLSVYLRGGVSAVLAPSRAMGGLGVGVGVRDVLKDRFILQADASYLTLLGHVGEVRLGAGVQRGGTWSPAALATVSLLMGDALTTRTETIPRSPRGPAGALGVTLAPLRFCMEGGSCVSVLELGVGYGTDFATAGPSLQVGLMEMGLAF